MKDTELLLEKGYFVWGLIRRASSINTDIIQLENLLKKLSPLKDLILNGKVKELMKLDLIKNTGRELIFISEKYFRPAEVEELLGDSTKARNKLGWKQCSFDDLVIDMVNSDCS